MARYSLIVALCLTIAAVFIYDAIPPKLYFINGDSGANYWLFEATNQWVDKDRLHFKCASTDKSCGINMVLGEGYTQGIDLSDYYMLHLRATYRGPVTKATVFIRNFNPLYSTVDDANSAQYLMLILDTSEFKNPDIRINLSEFTVARWWLDQRQLERPLRRPDFSNVTMIGIDFSNYLIEGQDIDFEIDSLVFEQLMISRENWYLGILLGWGGVVSLIVLNQMIKLVRQRSSLEYKVKEVEERSTLDHLTQVMNRLGMEAKIEEMTNGTPSIGACIVMIDIDHFKRINDTLGHDAGDRVLVEFANTLRSSLRGSDLLGRWGGEEFLLICPMLTLEEAAIIAEKLRSKVMAQRFLEPEGRLVTASFGVSYWAPGKEDFYSALKRADTALYEAKQAGRNCYQVAETPE